MVNIVYYGIIRIKYFLQKNEKFDIILKFTVILMPTQRRIVKTVYYDRAGLSQGSRAGAGRPLGQGTSYNPLALG